MSLPRYPRYKDSGEDWLGEVPEHWEVKPNKSFLSLCRSEVGHTSAEKTLLSLTLKGVIPRDLESGKGKFPADFGAYQDVAKDDLVFCLFDIDETPRTVGLAQESGMITGAYDVLRCKAHVLPQFVVYYYLHIDSFKGLRPFYTGLRKVVRPPTFMAIKVPMPPLQEQTQIAAFLDRETAMIDALVAEQRRLMGLLKEKRQAVISHAVTRGLNPDAPMKPSGIEWLGNVPEQWDAPYLGVLIDTADLGGNYESSESGNGIPLIKMGNLDRGFIKTNKVEYLPEEIEYSKSFILNHGDFLFNTRNSLDLVGKVAIWRSEIPLAIYNSNILRISFKRQKVGSTEFMSYFFNSDLGLSQLRLVAKGTTSVAAVYYKDLTTIRVVLPPIPVQHSIVDYLDDACTKLDTLTTEAQHAIDLLQERRTALISAAVTGQIDVRCAV